MHSSPLKTIFTKRHVTSLSAALFGLCTVSGVKADEGPFTPAQNAALTKTIESHLINNPHIVVTSLEKYQATQEQLAIQKTTVIIQKKKDVIFQNPRDYSAGNPKGSVNVVVFMDPFCGHCRRFHTVIEELLEDRQDKNLQQVRIIYKDLPILGDASYMAVRAMMAAKKQGDKAYQKMQQEMFSQEGELKPEDVLKVVRKLGLNEAKFSQDMNAADIKQGIDQNLELANLLGINGTPTLIIGETLSPGGMSLSDLKEKIIAAQQPSAAPPA